MTTTLWGLGRLVWPWRPVSFVAYFLFAPTFLQKITFVLCLYTVSIICFRILINVLFRQFLFVLNLFPINKLSLPVCLSFRKHDAISVFMLTCKDKVFYRYVLICFPFYLFSDLNSLFRILRMTDPFWVLERP